MKEDLTLKEKKVLQRALDEFQDNHVKTEDRDIAYSLGLDLALDIGCHNRETMNKTFRTICGYLDKLGTTIEQNRKFFVQNQKYELLSESQVGNPPLQIFQSLDYMRRKTIGELSKVQSILKKKFKYFQSKKSTLCEDNAEQFCEEINGMLRELERVFELCYFLKNDFNQLCLVSRKWFTKSK